MKESEKQDVIYSDIMRNLFDVPYESDNKHLEEDICQNNEHTDDGHSYDDPDDPPARYTTARCTKCGSYYRISKITGRVMEG